MPHLDVKFQRPPLIERGSLPTCLPGKLFIETMRWLHRLNSKRGCYDTQGPMAEPFETIGQLLACPILSCRASIATLHSFLIFLSDFCLCPLQQSAHFQENIQWMAG